MFTVEITDQEIIDERVDLFFTTIDNIISQENHPHKYPGSKKVLSMLNEICIELNMSMRFFQQGEHIGFQSRNIGIDIFFVGEVEKKFRKSYRHR